MENYSRQLDRFTPSTRFAYSYFRSQDERTYVSYYKDTDGLIHSSSFNYSIIGSKPVTIEEFRVAMAKDSKTTTVFI